MSGFRDLLAEQMIPREEVLGTIKSVYETYGFVPLKTPALERLETLAGKYGDEGEKLIYKFQDNGGRDVAMRYDQTVPLARVYAQYGSELPKPYKRYALGDVWRGESPQAGRYREFTQFDADTVGSSSYLADTEIIAMMHDAMSAIGVDTLIRVNDRKILDGLAARCEITDERDFRRLVGAIDKVDKNGAEAVSKEVGEMFSGIAGEIVATYLNLDGDTASKLDLIADLLPNEKAEVGLDNIRNVTGALAVAGYSVDGIIFDPSVARGLDYYTSTIYETTLTELPAIGSVCSGGRFDGLIETLGGPSTPAVGTSIGVDRLLEAMRQLGVLPEVKTRTRAFVINMADEGVPERFALTQRLRTEGIPSEIILEEAKVGKQIRAVNKLGVRYVIFYGLEEIEKGVLGLKDLQSGEQQDMELEEAINLLRNE